MSIILSIISILLMIFTTFISFILSTNSGAEFGEKVAILSGFILSYLLNTISYMFFKINFFDFKYYKISFIALSIITIIFIAKYIIENIISYFTYQYEK